MSLPCFGLSIGASTACLAVSKDGKVEVVASPTGDRVTPAIVAFQDSEVIVGLAAKQGRIRNLENTIVRNKNLLFPGPQADDSLVAGSAVQVAADKGGGKGMSYSYTVDYREREHVVSPGEVVGHILQYFHSIATSHTGDSSMGELNTVLTVPLHYSEEHRTLLSNIAVKAGFKVVQCISEPSASCLAYDISESPCVSPSPSLCLVVRVGGASTDLTLLEVAGGTYSVRDTVRDHSLGGDLFTEALVDHFAKEFKAKFKEDIRQSKRGVAKLRVQAEVVKHVLSSLDTAHCYVESLYDGMDFSSNVTRARFDSLVSTLIQELLSKVTSLLGRCGLKPSDIGSVVLSGGCTKVLRLQSQLSALLPQAELLASIPGDEVTAIGAATQASYIKSTEGLGGRPLSMLALTKDIKAVMKGGETDLVIVNKGTPLPVRRNASLPLPPDTETVTVDIMWGDSATPLASLTLEVGGDSKLVLVTHIHRDTGTTHITLQDKAKGASTDVVLK